MKIKPEHLATLQAAITPLDTEERRQRYRDGKFSNSCTNLNMRYRWDLLYASGLKIGDGAGMYGLPLYAYMDDTHIDTALKSFIKALS